MIHTMQTVKFTKSIAKKVAAQELQVNYDQSLDWYIFAKVYRDEETGAKFMQDIKVTGDLYREKKDDGTFTELEEFLHDQIKKQCKQAVGNFIPVLEPVA